MVEGTFEVQDGWQLGIRDEGTKGLRERAVGDGVRVQPVGEPVEVLAELVETLEDRLDGELRQAPCDRAMRVRWRACAADPW